VAWKFTLPNRISNPAGRGSELPMEYLWDLYSVRITLEMAGGKLIFSAFPYLARELSVRKVVPTLTSTSTEIYLSMASAKQHVDTIYPGSGRGSYVQQQGRSRRCIALHHSACGGELQAWRERRRGL
jgi:hypothetical protein